MQSNNKRLGKMDDSVCTNETATIAAIQLLLFLKLVL